MDARETQLEGALRRTEPAIGDDGFSDAVMSGLPRRRLSRTAARRLTLGGAAVAGSILTSVLGAPLETAFSALVLEGGYGLTVLAAVAIVSLIAVPVAWVFYSR
jgi:hypothetical protein